MNQQVYLTNMFPDYEPPEELRAALSQAAIVAADIFPETGTVETVLHSENYIPQRHLNQISREICTLYGLRKLSLTATHPETELHKIEPEELRDLFVSRNSMARGTLAGAQWEWEGCDLRVKLVANGKEELAEHIPVVQNLLRERFACPVTITVEAGKALEGKALFEAMESMRGALLQNLPAVSQQAKKEEKPQVQSDTFYGKPFKGVSVPMKG